MSMVRIINENLFENSNYRKDLEGTGIFVRIIEVFGLQRFGE